MKIFTMVKGEVDIVEDWVIYHGNLFGYSNIYVIDNYSFDGTYQVLVELKNKYNINITRLKDYSKKGEYMTMLLRNICRNELAFPIDIDEFIVYYDRQSNTISCDKNVIFNYLRSLPLLPYYKMNYIMSKLDKNDGCDRAAINTKYGCYSDTGSAAKTFFNSRLFKDKIDHGNHYTKNSYLLTKICLVHFHIRNTEQIKKKAYNNVVGLGHNPFDINRLKQTLICNPVTMGHHHIQYQIKILNNEFKLTKEPILDTDISLEPLGNMIKKIYNI
jgi:hypothetical protein